MLKREERIKNNSKKNIKLLNNKYLKEVKINLTQKNSNKRNINFSINNNTLSNAKTIKEIDETQNDLYIEERTEKENTMISFYDGTHKQLDIYKNNSIAYTRKRPNDYIKNNNLNRSTIASKNSMNSFTKNGRCASCINIKNKINISNNDNLKRNNSFYKDNNNSTKTTEFQKVNPFEINDFSFKNSEDKLNNEELSEFIDKVVETIKSHLMSLKVILFNNMKNIMKRNTYEISSEEYKLLEELKTLGVSNIKELNLLLKEIYLEIKGNKKNS